jgi:hypothetical protein
MVSPSSNGTTTNNRPSRGWRRMRELAREADAKRKTLTAELLAGLGRPATAVDRIAAENLAALHVKAIRLEASGRDATGVRQQITQAMRASGLRPDKPAPPKPFNIAAALAQGILPPSPQSADDAAKQPGDETHLENRDASPA